MLLYDTNLVFLTSISYQTTNDVICKNKMLARPVSFQVSDCINCGINAKCAHACVATIPEQNTRVEPIRQTVLHNVECATYGNLKTEKVYLKLFKALTCKHLSLASQKEMTHYIYICYSNIAQNSCFKCKAFTVTFCNTQLKQYLKQLHAQAKSNHIEISCPKVQYVF